MKNLLCFSKLTKEKSYECNTNKSADVSVFSDKKIDLYWEISTNTIWAVTKKGGISCLPDPETGFPLTYDKWKTNYQNK